MLSMVLENIVKLVNIDYGFKYTENQNGQCYNTF